MSVEKWGVRHRNEHGQDLIDEGLDSEADARDLLAACHSTEQPCVLIKRVQSPWTEVPA